MESLRRQSISEDIFEVIIVNDGSNDQTLSLLNDFQAVSQTRGPKNFSVFHQEHHGRSHAWHLGALKAQGKYLLFLANDVQISHKDYFLNHLKIHNDIENAVVFGPIRQKKEKPKTAWEKFYDLRNEVLYNELHEGNIECRITMFLQIL